MYAFQLVGESRFLMGKDVQMIWWSVHQ